MNDGEVAVPWLELFLQPFCTILYVFLFFWLFVFLQQGCFQKNKGKEHRTNTLKAAKESSMFGHECWIMAFQLSLFEKSRLSCNLL